jgi:hypothetical protein
MALPFGYAALHCSHTLHIVLGHADAQRNFFFFRRATLTGLVYNAFLYPAWTPVHESSGCGDTCCLLSRPLPRTSVPFYLFNCRKLLFGALPTAPGHSVFYICQAELCEDYHEIYPEDYHKVFFKDHNYSSCKDNFKIHLYKLSIKVYHRSWWWNCQRMV